MPDERMVWVVAAVEGAGYVREMVDGRPIIATSREAHEWATEADAQAVVDQIAALGKRVPMRAVQRPAAPDGPWKYEP